MTYWLLAGPRTAGLFCTPTASRLRGEDFWRAPVRISKAPLSVRPGCDLGGGLSFRAAETEVRR
jgi:hypothetical protein